MWKTKFLNSHFWFGFFFFFSILATDWSIYSANIIERLLCCTTYSARNWSWTHTWEIPCLPWNRLIWVNDSHQHFSHFVLFKFSIVYPHTIKSYLKTYCEGQWKELLNGHSIFLWMECFGTRSKWLWLRHCECTKCHWIAILTWLIFCCVISISIFKSSCGLWFASLDIFIWLHIIY